MLTPIAKLLIGIVVLGAVFVLGVSIDIASCFIFWNFWPLIVIPGFAVAPIPSLLVAHLVPPDLKEEYALQVRMIRDFGHLITGFAMMYGLGMPIALLHGDVIGWAAALMTIVGGVIMYISIYVYVWLFHRQIAADVMGVDDDFN